MLQTVFEGDCKHNGHKIQQRAKMDDFKYKKPSVTELKARNVIRCKSVKETKAWGLDTKVARVTVARYC